MQKKPLKKLLQDLERELLRLAYTEGSVKFYRNHWQKIIKFAEEHNETYYSEQLGIDFIEKYFQISNKDFYKLTVESWQG